MKEIKKKLAPVGQMIKKSDIVSTSMIEKLHVDGDFDTKTYTGGILTLVAEAAMAYIIITGLVKMI